MDPEEIVARAMQAVADGDDPAALQGLLEQQFGPNIAKAFQFRREAEQAATPAQRRLSASPGSGTGDLAALVGNSATFGWGDEMLNALGLDGEGFKQRVSDVREEAPLIARIAAEAIPGLLIPGGAALSASRTGGLLASAGRGALVGGVTGAALGAGEAEPGSRVAGAAKTGAMGAALGAATVPLMHGARTALNRGLRGSAPQQVAGAFAEGVGEAPPPSLWGRMTGRPAPLSTIRPVQEITSELAEGVESVRRNLYAPFDAQPADPRVLSTVYGNRFVQRVDNTLGRGEPPKTFADLKNLQTALNSKITSKSSDRARSIVERFNEAMEDAYPGLEAANMAFGRAKTVEEAFQLGLNGGRRAGQTQISGTSSAAALQASLRSLARNPEAQESLLVGVRQRALNDLLEGRTHTTLRRFVNATKDEYPRAQEWLFEVFGRDQAAYDKFIDVLNTSAVPQTVLDQFKAAAKTAAIGAAFGAGAGAVSIFQGYR